VGVNTVKTLKFEKGRVHEPPPPALLVGSPLGRPQRQCRKWKGMQTMERDRKIVMVEGGRYHMT